MTSSIPTEHDSNAVYMADTHWIADRVVAAQQLDAWIPVWSSGVPAPDHGTGPDCRFGDPPDRDTGLPIYLLTASLRL